MISKPQDWDNVKAFAEGQQALPLGAYVVKVKSAKVEPNQYGSQLMIAFDIVEGDYKDFYERQFNASTVPGKKWKGVLRQWLPLNNGEERDEITKRSLKGLTSAFEKSNPGYVWNWDETSLIGKTVGILMRNEEYEVDDRHGWAVRPFRAITADRVRTGDFTLPKDKPLRSDAAEPSFPSPSYTAPSYNAQKAPQQKNNFVQVEDDELPF